MKRFFVLLAFSTTALIATASTPATQTDNEPFLVNVPERYDSLMRSQHTDNIISSYEAFFNDFINIEADSTLDLSQALPDSVYMARLKMMLSPINLPYNEVLKKFLVTYTTSRKKTMAHILGLSKYYFPMFEQELANAGLPLELRMLPVIESALSPTAVSRMKATGIWQFMYGTGKAFGLEITSFVDQRCDPVAATKAACAYLKDLYHIYGDWTLAIAAYNCGAGNVNKALKRAGDKAQNFWDVYPYLPTETRGYLPSFVAATYAYNYHKIHGIDPVPMPLPVATDTVMVNRLMHLQQVATTLGTPIETLRELNPQYKLDIIPAVGSKCYTLTLPSDQAIKYIEKEEEIYAKDTVYLAKYLKTSQPLSEKQFNSAAQTHKVKSGDTLGAIAKKYGVSVNSIMKSNSIKNANALRIGQVLQIF